MANSSSASSSAPMDTSGGICANYFKQFMNEPFEIIDEISSVNNERVDILDCFGKNLRSTNIKNPIPLSVNLLEGAYSKLHRERVAFMGEKRQKENVSSPSYSTSPYATPTSDLKHKISDNTDFSVYIYDPKNIVHFLQMLEFIENQARNHIDTKPTLAKLLFEEGIPEMIEEANIVDLIIEGNVDSFIEKIPIMLTTSREFYKKTQRVKLCIASSIQGLYPTKSSHIDQSKLTGHLKKMVDSFTNQIKILLNISDRKVNADGNVEQRKVNIDGNIEQFIKNHQSQLTSTTGPGQEAFCLIDKQPLQYVHCYCIFKFNPISGAGSNISEFELKTKIEQFCRGSGSGVNFRMVTDIFGSKHTQPFIVDFLGLQIRTVHVKEYTQTETFLKTQVLGISKPDFVERPEMTPNMYQLYNGGKIDNIDENKLMYTNFARNSFNPVAACFSLPILFNVFHHMLFQTTLEEDSDKIQMPKSYDLKLFHHLLGINYKHFKRPSMSFFKAVWFSWLPSMLSIQSPESSLHKVKEIYLRKYYDDENIEKSFLYNTFYDNFVIENKVVENFTKRLMDSFKVEQDPYDLITITPSTAIMFNLPVHERVKSIDGVDVFLKEKVVVQNFTTNFIESDFILNMEPILKYINLLKLKHEIHHKRDSTFYNIFDFLASHYSSPYPWEMGVKNKDVEKKIDKFKRDFIVKGFFYEFILYLECQIALQYNDSRLINGEFKFTVDSDNEYAYFMYQSPISTLPLDTLYLKLILQDIMIHPLYCSVMFNKTYIDSNLVNIYSEKQDFFVPRLMDKVNLGKITSSMVKTIFSRIDPSLTPECASQNVIITVYDPSKHKHLMNRFLVKLFLNSSNELVKLRENESTKKEYFTNVMGLKENVLKQHAWIDVKEARKEIEIGTPSTFILLAQHVQTKDIVGWCKADYHFENSIGLSHDTEFLSLNPTNPNYLYNIKPIRKSCIFSMPTKFDIAEIMMLPDYNIISENTKGTPSIGVLMGFTATFIGTILHETYKPIQMFYGDGRHPSTTSLFKSLGMINSTMLYKKNVLGLSVLPNKEYDPLTSFLPGNKGTRVTPSPTYFPEDRYIDSSELFDKYFEHMWILAASSKTNLPWKEWMSFNYYHFFFVDSPLKILDFAPILLNPKNDKSGLTDKVWCMPFNHNLFPRTAFFKKFMHCFVNDLVSCGFPKLQKNLRN
jgi:hypothetical protein